MRILVATPAYEDSFAENVVVTLRSMGHEVHPALEVSHRSYYSLPRSLLRAVAGRVLPGRPGREDLRVLALARSLRPDLVLSLTRSLHPAALEGIRKTGARLVIWWGDTPANSTRWGFLDPAWDLVLLKDASAVSKLRMVGRNAHLLHEAMNPVWHRPVAKQSNDRISVVGNSYAFRQAVCLRLLEHGVGVDIFGPRPPSWSSPDYRRAHKNRYVVKEEKSRVFGEALGCLNTFALSEGNSLNCRAFEIAGAGGLQFLEYRPAVDACFEPGKEVLTFDTFDALLEHIRHAQVEPATMKKIRQAATRRALAEHTYRHRLDRLLELAEQI